LPLAEEIIGVSFTPCIPAEPAKPEDNVEYTTNTREQQGGIEKNASENNREVQ